MASDSSFDFDLPRSSLLVSEKFVSLQGEGISTGAPAAFVRLGRCNLTCHYCDTAYTWDASRFDLERELFEESLEEIQVWLLEHAPGRLILTGGEPLIQQKKIALLLEGLDGLFAREGEKRLFVEVETNGTILPSPALFERIDQWNVSPKLKAARVDEKIRIRPRVLERLSEHGAFFKFVVSTEEDVAEVHQLVELLALDPARVQLMPEAQDAITLRERAPRVAEWAQKSAYRYSGRLHLELFGGRRGT